MKLEIVFPLSLLVVTVATGKHSKESDKKMVENSKYFLSHQVLHIFRSLKEPSQ